MQATEISFEDFEPMATDIPSHIDFAVLAAYADYEGINSMEEAVERFEDNYQGTFASLEDWANNLLEETGELSEMPERLRYYFDFSMYARDCILNGDIWSMETDSGTAVFWNR